MLYRQSLFRFPTTRADESRIHGTYNEARRKTRCTRTITKKQTRALKETNNNNNNLTSTSSGTSGSFRRGDGKAGASRIKTSSWNMGELSDWSAVTGICSSGPSGDSPTRGDELDAVSLPDTGRGEEGGNSKRRCSDNSAAAVVAACVIIAGRVPLLLRCPSPRTTTD